MMRIFRPAALVVAVAVASCTAPAYTCGHAVPCARGGVQSCTSRDGARCRYLLSDGTHVECASCDDCFAAERDIAAWCAVGSVIGGNGGNGAGNGAGSSSADLATDEPRDMSVGGVVDPPPDLAAPVADFSTAAPGDGGPLDTDLGCYGFGYACNADPTCCAHCCAGGCTTFGYCALQ